MHDDKSNPTPEFSRKALLDCLSAVDDDAAGRVSEMQSLFSLRSTVIQYDGFKAAVRELARIHKRGLFAADFDSFQMVGQTGSGKSTLLKWYAAKFPRYELEGRTYIPVLYLELPESPTVKGLAAEILRQMGDPFAQKGTTQEMTARIIDLSRKSRIELIILDEIQHLIEAGRKAELRRLTDWLKGLINTVKCPIVLAGLPLSILVTRSNPQLRRRFQTPYHFESFSMKTKEKQLEFRGVLKVFFQQMPSGSVDISGHDLAQRVYFASGGLMDYVVKLINDAVSRGGTGDLGAVTMGDLSLSFRRVVWGSAPDRLNPFITGAKLRFLDGSGEPFEFWDSIDRYLTPGKKSESSLH